MSATVEELVRRAKALARAIEDDAVRVDGDECFECGADWGHLHDLAARLDAAILDHERAEIMAATR